MLQELFGPLSMRELENDAYVRKTTGYLPEASVAFVDEIFKANSAILNTLLTILNERSFDNGNQRYQIPLMCMVSLALSTRGCLEYWHCLPSL
jgi:MoxR-like ATPase